MNQDYAIGNVYCSAHVASLRGPILLFTYTLDVLVLIMKILPIIIPCCLLICCEQQQDKSNKSTPNPTVSTQPVQPIRKTPSLLDAPEELHVEVDHEAKFTFNPPENNSVITFGNYVSKRPKNWFWVIPKTLVVTCNYVLPSSTTSDPALFTITQFENKDSESMDKSITRWKDLFRSDGGGPITATKQSLTIADREATQITMLGEYMGAGFGWRLQNHMLLVTILRDETHTTYLKVIGPHETITIQRNAINEFLSSTRWVEPIVEE